MFLNRLENYGFLIILLLLSLPSCSLLTFSGQDYGNNNLPVASNNATPQEYSGNLHYINMGKLFNLLVMDIIIKTYKNNYHQLVELDASEVNNINIVDSDRYRLSFAYMELGSLDISLTDYESGYIWTRKMFKPEIEETINNLRTQYDSENSLSISFDEWLEIWTIDQAVSFYIEYIYYSYNHGEYDYDENLEYLLSGMDEIWGIELINNTSENISITYSFPVGRSTLRYEIKLGDEVIFDFDRQILDSEGRELRIGEFNLEIEI